MHPPYAYVLRPTLLCLGLSLLLLMACRKENPPLRLASGMHLTQSVTIASDTFRLDPLPGDSAVLTISGENILIDFNGAVLLSNSDPQAPDQLKNWGIRILKGKNIELRNLNIQGFRGGIWASHCDSLKITQTNIRNLYRYRQDLYRPRPNRIKFLPPTSMMPPPDFHGINPIPSPPPAAAIYLDHCSHISLRELDITRVQDGLLLRHCNVATIYNNRIQFNSGKGISLSHVQNLWLAHNRLDWNHWAIHLGPQCLENTIAYNSATHGLEGIAFTDSSSHQQLIFGNDFSHQQSIGAALRGSNNFIYNRVKDCRIGIAGKDLFDSFLLGNQMIDNEVNFKLPSGDGILQSANTDSLAPYPRVAEFAPPPLPDGQDTDLPKGQMRGRDYRLMQTWGPYDFRSPLICLRQAEGKRHTFAIFGPQGNWKLIGGNGFDYVSRKSGALPTTLVADQTAGADTLNIQLRFLGEAVQTIYGENIPRGAGVDFEWTNF